MKVYEYIVRIKDQSSDKLRKLAAGFSSSRTGVDRYNNSVNNAEKSTNRFGGAASLLARYLGPAVLGAALLGFTMKASALGRQLEQTRISFEVMVGSVRGGQALFKEVQELANVTPFTSTDLQSASKLLLNFGVNAKKVIPTLKTLGDISGGDANRLHYLTLAFAQTQAAGRLMGQDLLQMVNAGFNPLQEISRKTGLSLVVLKEKMEDGAISAQMVEAAFKGATEEGGKFFGMMERQSKTFEGRLSTLKDNWELALGGLGEKLNQSLSPVLDEIIRKLEHAVDRTKALGKENEADLNNLRKLNTEVKPLLVRYEALEKKRSKGGLNNSELREAFSLEQQIKELFPQARKIKDNRVVGIDAAGGLTNIQNQNSQFNNTSLDKIMSLESDLRKTQEIIDRKGEQSGVNKFLFGSDYKDPVKTLLEAEQKKVELLDQINAIVASRNLVNDPFAKGSGSSGAGAYADLMNPDKGKSKKTKDGIDRITGGGKQAVHVNITMENLIGTQKFDVTNVKESVTDMQKQVTEALLQLLNSAQFSLAQ